MCLIQSRDPTKTGAKRILAKLMKSKFINEYYECNPMDKKVTIKPNNYKYKNDVICNDKNIKNKNVINVHGNSYKYNKNGNGFKNVSEINKKLIKYGKSLIINRKYGKYYTDNIIDDNNKTGKIPIGKHVNVNIKMINKKNMNNMNNKINNMVNNDGDRPIYKYQGCDGNECDKLQNDKCKYKLDGTIRHKIVDAVFNLIVVVVYELMNTCLHLNLMIQNINNKDKMSKIVNILHHNNFDASIYKLQMIKYINVVKNLIKMMNNAVNKCELCDRRRNVDDNYSNIMDGKMAEDANYVCLKYFKSNNNLCFVNLFG
eukprot:161651_1